MSSDSLAPAVRIKHEQLPALRMAERRSSSSSSGEATDRRGCQAASAFLEKLYDILDEPAYCEYISWSKNGDTIIIKRVAEFSSLVLPKYYKHNNFQSFVRQLNMYSFSKTRHDANWREFKQELFQRGRRDLLQFIKRKASANHLKAKHNAATGADAPSSSSSSSSSSAAQPTTELQRQLDDAVEEIRAMRHHMGTLETHIWLLNERCNTISTTNESLQKQLQWLQSHGRQTSAEASASNTFPASQKIMSSFEYNTTEWSMGSDATTLKDSTPAKAQRQNSVTIQHTHTHTHIKLPGAVTHSSERSATNNCEGEDGHRGITEVLSRAEQTGIEALAMAANLRSAMSNSLSRLPHEVQPQKRARMNLEDLLDAATSSAAAGLFMVSKAHTSNNDSVEEGIGKLVQAMTASPKNQDYLTSFTIGRTPSSADPTNFARRSAVVPALSDHDSDDISEVSASSTVHLKRKLSS